MKFKDKIYDLRKNKGLSQEELGNLVNVTRQTVSKWELGETKPTSEKMIELAKVLNVDIKDLLDDDTVIKDNQNSVDTNELKPRKWLLVLLIIIALVIVVILANKVVTDKKNDNSSHSIFDIFDNLNISSKMFNSKYDFYKGSHTDMHTKELLDEIITNNKTNKKHLITVIYNDIETTDPNKIKEIKSTMKDSLLSNSYDISFDYDSKNYLNKVTIEDIGNTKKDELNGLFENIIGGTTQFNSTFELYEGRVTGSNFVYSILDEVINKNRNYENHQVEVSYSNTITTNSEEIRELKNSFETFGTYDIWLDYDKDGYVNRVNIKKVEE